MIFYAMIVEACEACFDAHLGGYENPNFDMHETMLVTKESRPVWPHGRSDRTQERAVAVQYTSSGAPLGRCSDEGARTFAQESPDRLGLVLFVRRGRHVEAIGCGDGVEGRVGQRHETFNASQRAVEKSLLSREPGRLIVSERTYQQRMSGRRGNRDWSDGEFRLAKGPVDGLQLQRYVFVPRAAYHSLQSVELPLHCREGIVEFRRLIVESRQLIADDRELDILVQGRQRCGVSRA